ncbi:hypothetical protein AMTRI_Chr08g204480 [Amborella trichopoda]
MCLTSAQILRQQVGKWGHSVTDKLDLVFVDERPPLASSGSSKDAIPKKKKTPNFGEAICGFSGEEEKRVKFLSIYPIVEAICGFSYLFVFNCRGDDKP